MAQRVTRSVNENKILGTTKNSNNVPVLGNRKRKAFDEAPKDVILKKGVKRAAFGDLTNAKGSDKNVTTGGNLKSTVKKGFSSIVGKGKSSSTVKAVLPKEVVSVVKEEAPPALCISTSSEEALLCNLSSNTSSSSADVTVSAKVPTPTAPKCRSPYRPTPPAGVADFDLETMGDPQQHSEYAMETFKYYQNREKAFRVPTYMSAQTEITEPMRAILVDWLVEVQESFELNHETLYTAVKMTDLYLSKKQVKKEDLQLVGATACLIACKVDERIPPMVDDFLYVCDDAYSREQLMKMERKMLTVVGFDVGYSLSYRFLRRYGRVCRLTMPVLTLARFILELSLMEYTFNVESSESQVAAGCLVLALKMKDIKGWGPSLSYYSGYKVSSLQPMVNRLLAMMKQPSKDNLKTVRSKYGHKVFHEVASTPLPDVVTIDGEEELKEEIKEEVC